MNCDRRVFVLALWGAAASARAFASELAFTPESSKSALEQFLLGRNVVLAGMRATQIVDEMLAFYRTGQVVGIASEPQSDMLLYQWGAYDWGQGRWFEFDVTRQFIRKAGEDAEISQLSLKAVYPPAEVLSAIVPGNMWCKSKDELPAFARSVRQTSAFSAVAFLRPAKVEAVWSPV
jgi:hypothetical protein